MNLSTRIPSKMLCNCVCSSVIYGGSNLIDVGQFDSVDVEVLFSLGSGDYITVALRNYYLFLQKYNHKDHCASLCFDPHFLHHGLRALTMSTRCFFSDMATTIHLSRSSISISCRDSSRDALRIVAMKNDAGIVGDYNTFRNEMFRRVVFFANI